MWAGIPLQDILRVPQRGPYNRSATSSGLSKADASLQTNSSAATRSLSLSKCRHLFAYMLPSTGSGGGLFLLQKKTPPQRRTAIQAVIPNLIRDLYHIQTQLIQTLNRVQGDGCGVAYRCKSYYVCRKAVPATAAQRQAAC